MEATLSIASRRLWTALVFSIFLSGCASARKAATSPEPRPVETTAPSEIFGPREAYGPEPIPSPAPAPAYGPEPIQIRPVILVLGPGLARGYAYAGALRALSEAKIPVGAIFGTEMGALIGALYGMDANINHLEWALLRFKEDVFLSEKKLIPTRRLDSELAKAFGERDLATGKIPVRVALEIKGTGRVLVLDKGLAHEALRAAMATPELLGPGKWQGSPAVSAKYSRPFQVNEAKALGTGPVIVIDVMDLRDSNGVSELGGADLVIRPDMRGIGEFEFQKKTEATFRGKKAVLDHLAEIRHWVGLPEGGP